MATNDKGKSKADQYREERKARIAKDVKRKASKSERSLKIQKIIGRVIAAVIALGLVSIIVWNSLGFAGTIQIMTPVAAINGEKVSQRDFTYFYMLLYNNTVNQDSQYEQQYGQDVMGFDAEKSPDNQNYPQKVNNETITWAQYFSNNALDYAQQYQAMYTEALAKNYKLTADEQKTIDEQIETVRTKAAGNNMSLNAYLRLSYGKGISERFLRKQMEKDIIIKRFNDDNIKVYESKCTESIIKKTYEKDKDTYDVVSLRTFKFALTKLTAKKGETTDALANRQKAADNAVKAKADAMLSGITDEASFLSLAKTNTKAVKGVTYDASSDTGNFYKSKSTLESSLSKDAADWAFGDGRKAGDKKVFKTDDNYYVVWVKTPQFPPATVNVRHILLSYTDPASDYQKATTEQKAAAKNKANDVYDEWKKGKKTQDSFAALANKYSKDTGNKSEDGKQLGGLYEKVETGKMDSSFENWCFDPARKAGDTGIITTVYGYHVMYFVKNNYPEFSYISAIKTDYAAEENQKYVDNLKKDKYKIVDKNSKNITAAKAACLKIINKNIEANAQNSAQSY